MVTNNNARKMKFGSCDEGEYGKHGCVCFVEASNILAMRAEFLDEMQAFNRN